MATDAGQYQVLDIPQTTSRKKHILGSIIPSDRMTAPFDKYCPYLDDPRFEKAEGKKQKAEIETNLDLFWRSPDGEDGPTKFEHLNSSQGNGQSSFAQAKITDALKGRYNKGSIRNFRLDDAKIEQYTIDNPGMALPQRLVKCTPWMNAFKDFYKDNDLSKLNPQHPYMIVTGVYICKDAKISWEDEQASAAGFEAKMPISETTSAVAKSQGLPISKEAARPLDSEAKYLRDQGASKRSETVVAEPIIFALRYHILDIVLESPKPHSTAEPKSKLSRLLSGKNPFKRTNSELASVDTGKREIKSLALGQPVRGGPNMIGSYGNKDKDLFYYDEPDFVSPDEIQTPAGAVQTNGAAH